MEYYIALGIMFILSYFTNRRKVDYRLGVKISTTKSFRHAFLLLLPLTFLIVFRWNVGVDSVYGNSYSTAYRYAARGINSRNFEIGYYWLSRLFASMGIPFFWFLFAHALFFMLCVAYGINKGSVAPTISVLVFFFVQVYFDAFSALRQAIAEGLAIIALSKVGTEPKSRRRDIICFCILGIASLFHTVSILYFVIFFLCDRRLERKLYVTIAIVGLAAYPVIQIALRYAMKLIIGNRYTFMEFGSSYMILTGIILLVCIINYNTIVLMNPNAYFFMNMALVNFLLMMNSNALFLPYRVFDAIKVGYIFIIPYTYVSCRKPIEGMVYRGLIIAMIGIWFFASFYMAENVMANYQSVFPVWNTATRLP